MNHPVCIVAKYIDCATWFKGLSLSHFVKTVGKVKRFEYSVWKIFNLDLKPPIDTLLPILKAFF